MPLQPNRKALEAQATAVGLSTDTHTRPPATGHAPHWRPGRKARRETAERQGAPVVEHLLRRKASPTTTSQNTAQ